LLLQDLLLTEQSAVVERYVTSTEQLKRTAIARLDFLEEATD
jgi:hypothetical protein